MREFLRLYYKLLDEIADTTREAIEALLIGIIATGYLLSLLFLVSIPLWVVVLGVYFGVTK